MRQQSCLYLGEEHSRKREQPGQSKSRTGLFKKQIEGGLMESIKSGEMEEAEMLCQVLPSVRWGAVDDQSWGPRD